MGGTKVVQGAGVLPVEFPPALKPSSKLAPAACLYA